MILDFKDDLISFVHLTFNFIILYSYTSSPMGNICGQNTFDELYKKYGDDLAKYMALAKG